MKQRLLIFLVFCLVSFASALPEKALAGFDLFDTTSNQLIFPKGDSAFTPFFEKLDSLVFENKGKIRILHIGGSHIQADVISGKIRERFAKTYPATPADRGFVFPYSAARTNTPSSYSSAYRGKWDMSKNVLREITKPLGLLGIAVSTEDPRAEFTIALNRYNPDPIWYYDQVRLFGYSDSNDVKPVLHLDSTIILGEFDSTSSSYVFNLPRLADTLQISMLWNDTLLQDSLTKAIEDSIRQDSINALIPKDSLSKDSLSEDSLKLAINDSLLTQPALDSMFQDSLVIADTVLRPRFPKFTLSGILLENKLSGIAYTSVGINGARVPNYFKEPCPNFEKELAFFKPDLVILAVGINDANVEHFNEKQFMTNYDTLITRLRNISPNVPIIFTTNNDSYRKKRRRYVEHPNGELARQAFFQMAEKYNGAVWDMFSLMGGLGSMKEWEKAGLAKKDKVHFTHAGYVFLGDMFYRAFLKAYYMHLAKKPAEEPENKEISPVDKKASESPTAQTEKEK